MQALNSNPSDASLPGDFLEVLPLLARTRTYHLQQPKQRREKALLEYDSAGKGKVPSAPPHIYIAKGTGPAAKWKISWEAPADAGSDTIYEYACELSHEDPLAPGTFTPHRQVYCGKGRRFDFDAKR